MEFRRSRVDQTSNSQLQALHSTGRQTSSTRNGRFAARKSGRIFYFQQHMTRLLWTSLHQTQQQPRKKLFVAIFICFATKPVHMETVNSLTKDDWLDAVKRFCARRGLSKAFHSDNSMTFIGSRGETEFQKLMMSKDFEEIFSTFTNDKSVSWYTIPPRAPNFGGLLDAAVKSLKHFFRKVGETRPQFYQLPTVPSQIEAITTIRHWRHCYCQRGQHPAFFVANGLYN